MTTIPIYTIGYGNRTIQEFIALLQQYSIQYLVDIRSQPYSRYNPDFSKEALERKLKQAGVRYMFMGDTLGGRPDDSDCYLEDGTVAYKILSEKPFFQQGLKRIRTAWEKQLRVALMCSELKPEMCHRSKLIGNALIEQDIVENVAHIDESGNTKTQEEVNSILGVASYGSSLFGDQISAMSNDKIGLSRKKYSPKGERI